MLLYNRLSTTKYYRRANFFCRVGKTEGTQYDLQAYIMRIADSYNKEFVICKAILFSGAEYLRIKKNIVGLQIRRNVCGVQSFSGN